MSEFNSEEKRDQLLEEYNKKMGELEKNQKSHADLQSNILRLQGAIAVLNEQIGDVDLLNSIVSDNTEDLSQGDVVSTNN